MHANQGKKQHSYVALERQKKKHAAMVPTTTKIHTYQL